jgi:hypothetical protein
MPIHPWLGVEHVQPQPQVPPLVHVQLVVQPQPQEQGAAGTAGWVMGVEQVQVMGFLLLVVDGGSGSAASVNQASTLQWSGESKGGSAVYRAEPQKWDGVLRKSLPQLHRHEPAGARARHPHHPGAGHWGCAAQRSFCSWTNRWFSDP